MTYAYMTPRPSIAAVLLEGGAVPPPVSPSANSPFVYASGQGSTPPESPDSLDSHDSLDSLDSPDLLTPLTPFTPAYICLDSPTELTFPPITHAAAAAMAEEEEEEEVISMTPTSSPPASPSRPALRVNVPKRYAPPVVAQPFPRTKASVPASILLTSPTVDQLPILDSPVSTYSPLSAYPDSPLSAYPDTPVTAVSEADAPWSAVSAPASDAPVAPVCVPARSTRQRSRSIQFVDHPHPRHVDSPGGLRPDSAPRQGLGRGRPCNPRSLRQRGRNACSQPPAPVVSPPASALPRHLAHHSPHGRPPGVALGLAPRLSPRIVRRPFMRGVLSPLRASPIVPLSPLTLPPQLCGPVAAFWGAVYWIWVYYVGLNPLACVNSGGERGARAVRA